MTSVYASVFPEIEVEVEGDWFPPVADTWDCPGNGAFSENESITGLVMSHRGRDGKMVRVDLLAGVDRKDPGFQQLMSNLLEALRDQVEETLALSGYDDA